MRPGWKSALAAALVAAAGCGPKKIAVTGLLTVKGGGPVPGGMVVFAPVGGGGAGGARGYVNLDGTFAMSTDKPDDGTLAGRYKVLIVPPPTKKGGEDAQAAPPPIDPRYAEFDQSGLEVEVTPDRHHFEFALDPPGKKK